MITVSNDLSWWPEINSNTFNSYWMVAAGVVVVYDWVLTLGQEIELIWRQRWSFMTVLYLLIRYIGIPYSVADVLRIMPFVSLTDVGCKITYHVIYWTDVVVAAMLCIIMIARLHAMYQGSRMMLIFLVIIFLAVNIACGVITGIDLKYVVAEEVMVSGMYICEYGYEGDKRLLASMVWILSTVWEVLALCLSAWVAVKHFRDLRRPSSSTGLIIGDCFTVLIKSHVFYFASFLGVSCLQLLKLSTEIWTSNSIGGQILPGALQILLVVQMFVLGPRLIIHVREYHAKLVTDSDAENSMNLIVFQEHVFVSTSSTV